MTKRKWVSTKLTGIYDPDAAKKVPIIHKKKKTTTYRKQLKLAIESVIDQENYDDVSFTRSAIRNILEDVLVKGGRGE